MALELAAGRGYQIQVEYVRAFLSRDEQAGAGGGAEGLAWEYVSLGVRAPRGRNDLLRISMHISNEEIELCQGNAQ